MGPTEVFMSASAAMERGDLHAFFRCFERNTLNVLLKNSVLLSLHSHRGSEAEFIGISQKYNLDAAAVRDVVFDVPDKEHMRHYVTRANKTIRAALRKVNDLPGLAADLDLHNRKMGAGGSISLKLFVGETLTDLVVEGERAWATRRITESYSATVGFVKENGNWRIQLISRRPRKKRG